MNACWAGAILFLFDHCGDLNYLVRSWVDGDVVWFATAEPVFSIELTLLSFNRNDGDLAPNEAHNMGMLTMIPNTINGPPATLQSLAAAGFPAWLALAYSQ